MPEITVVITAYNLADFIDVCLNELEEQTMKAFDVLVVDDCSTDHTASIVRRHMDKGIIPISLVSTEKNCGLPGKTRNFALDSGLIDGKYVVFLDGDDSIECDFLQQLYEHAESSKAEITLCAYDRFENETGHILCQEMRGFSEEISLPPQDDVLAFINGSLWNKLILKSCIGEKRIPDFKVGEDLSFLLDLYCGCTKIACVDQVLIHYRVHSMSVISNTQERTIHQFAEYLQSLWENADQLWMKNTIGLVAFIHIGLSMMMRGYDNPEIQTKLLIQWTTRYFKKNYQWFRQNPYLKFKSLVHHGIKGVGLWAALVSYRCHCFGLYIWLYKTFTGLLHIDIKF